MFYIRRDYYCPHCHRWQSFLSILPVLSDRWRCRGCQKTFEIDAVCVASNWAVVAAVCGSELLHARGASTGLLFIGATLGAMVLLTGAFILAITFGDADPSGRIDSTWMIGIGTLFMTPCALVLLRRRTAS